MGFYTRLKTLLLNKRVFLRGSAVLAVTATLSNLLGLLRDRLLAHAFGASRALDAYNAAFIVPNLLLNIFVAGALTAAFVPIFSGLISRGERAEAKEFANSVLNSSILVVLITGALVWIFSSQLARLIVPGFDQASREIFIRLLRLLLLSPLIFAASNALGNILVSEERFFWYGISSALYNIGIIGGTVLLASRYGIFGVVWGAIAGAVLHLISRLIGLGKKYWHYRLWINWDRNFKKYIKLMLPRMAGHPIEQVIFLGFTAMASLIGAGSIVVINIANNFQTVPVAIIGITFALTAFPILAKIAARHERQEFARELAFTVKTIIITTAPFAVLMYFLRRPIIGILIGGGAFNRQAVELTAAALGAFAPSIVTESLNHLLARAFYALKNSAVPTLVALGGLIITLVSAYNLLGRFGVIALPLGYLAGSFFKLIMHSILLKSRLNKSFSAAEALTAATEHN